jgi:ribosomal protein RSM22 (predicted rRNA methylase)
MQIPGKLREAMDRMLEGVSRTALADRAARISELYREGGGSAAAIRDEADALTYAVSRMPATYAAVRNAMARLQERCPDFAPCSALDLGAGPGTASWAAVDAWPGIESITQVDSNAELSRIGAALASNAASGALRNASRVSANLTQFFDSTWKPDLILLSYTLSELNSAQSTILLTNAWLVGSGAILIVEPGTPRGYSRVVRARELLLHAGAHVAAPCPHELECPLSAPDWCHFTQRVARSRDQMILKDAALGYEDEKFSYVALVREELYEPSREDRVLAQPAVGKSVVTIKLCKTNGVAELVSIQRRDAEAFRRAKKTDWGDSF